MKRVLGMIQKNEVECEKNYKDNDGCPVQIQACPHGWAITYADLETDFKDVEATTEENFKAAFSIAEEKMGSLTELGGYGVVTSVSISKGGETPWTE